MYKYCNECKGSSVVTNCYCELMESMSKPKSKSKLKPKSKPKPVCRYGSSCYRKNHDHLNKYYHPSEDK